MATFLLYRTRPEDRNPSGLQAVIVTAADEATARAVANAQAPNGSTEVPASWTARDVSDAARGYRRLDRRRRGQPLGHDPRRRPDLTTTSSAPGRKPSNLTHSASPLTRRGAAEGSGAVPCSTPPAPGVLGGVRAPPMTWGRVREGVGVWREAT